MSDQAFLSEHSLLIKKNEETQSNQHMVSSKCHHARIWGEKKKKTARLENKCTLSPFVSLHAHVWWSNDCFLIHQGNKSFPKRWNSTAETYPPKFIPLIESINLYRSLSALCLKSCECKGQLKKKKENSRLCLPAPPHASWRSSLRYSGSFRFRTVSCCCTRAPSGVRTCLTPLLNAPVAPRVTCGQQSDWFQPFSTGEESKVLT